jgi:hypothetical protein
MMQLLQNPPLCISTKKHQILQLHLHVGTFHWECIRLDTGMDVFTTVYNIDYT